jgi:hypothetical protein
MKLLLAIAFSLMTSLASANVKQFTCPMIVDGYFFGDFVYNIDEKEFVFYFPEGRLFTEYVDYSGPCKIAGGDFCIFAKRTSESDSTISFVKEEYQAFVSGESKTLHGWLVDELVFRRIPLDLNCSVIE